MSEKLNEEIIVDFLKLKPDGNLYHRESQYLEFKESFNLAGLEDYYRDFAAFTNNRGGYIIFGVKDRPKREPVGLSDNAIKQFDKLDPEFVSGHLLNIFSGNIVWEYDIFKIDKFTFGVFYIHESSNKPVICKKDKDHILKNGEIYFRYGGRTQKIQYAELENIINYRIQQFNNHWIDLVQKIGKAGPQNAAVLDTERGLIEKNESQILVVDEELVKKMQWIREGEFVEKKGERTLKLVGTVQPINQIEIIKKVKENKLKDYPLSATEMVEEVKRIKPNVKLNNIYDVIRDNKLKDNPVYSSYVFRNHRQELDYEKNNVIPKGTPSIYKQSVVNYIIKVIENEYE